MRWTNFAAPSGLVLICWLAPLPHAWAGSLNIYGGGSSSFNTYGGSTSGLVIHGNTSRPYSGGGRGEFRTYGGSTGGLDIRGASTQLTINGRATDFNVAQAGQFSHFGRSTSLRYTGSQGRLHTYGGNTGRLQVYNGGTRLNHSRQQRFTVGQGYQRLQIRGGSQDFNFYNSGSRQLAVRH